MKQTIWMAVLLSVVALAPLRAAESNDAPKASATFADLLKRVMLRDPDSGAIVYVKAKEDAPQYGDGRLFFEMSQEAGREAVKIQCRTQTMTLNVVEMYQLNIDPSIRAELSKLKLMKEQATQKAIELQKQQSERINRLTDGKLKYGMSPQQVIAVLGPPLQEVNGYQQAGRSALVYKDYTLDFDNGLREILLPQ